jgi:WD40 repeat protein
MMVGTFGHEIVCLPINFQNQTCNVAQAQILINGHFAPRNDWTNEAWGLSIFPSAEKYVSCSDDGKIKVWDTKQRKLIKSIDLNLDNKGQLVQLDANWKKLTKNMQGRAIDISKNGELLAVGLNDGGLRVFQTSNWQMVHYHKQHKEWIEDLKFSPCGKFLCVSSHDNKMQIYSMPNGQKLHNKPFGVSSSYITHLDWSQDSQYIRTNDGSYELLYYSRDGKQIKGGASQFKDEPWTTHSCVFSWATQGVW